MANLRCEVCGSELKDHICVTSGGDFLCWECFVAFLRLLRRRKEGIG